MTNALVKLVIVFGIGGARADLVAGWLGTLPGFVNSRWIIDPETGVSYGHQGNIRAIDQNVPLEEVLNNQGLTLDPNAEFTWAVACHGYNLKLQDFKQHIDSGAVKFVYVDARTANQNKVAWEFYVKTYLSHRRSLESVRGWSEQWIIGQDLSDQERIQKLKNLLTTHRNRHIIPAVPCDVIDYSKAFVPGGSRYICDVLGITAPDVYHQYYDSVLPYTHSPESINVWGVNWQRQDYFPD